jgi:transcriptional antiterminator NusG
VVSDSQQKNILKGYILSHCHLTSELTRFLYKMPEVIGFLNHQRGEDKLPDPVSEEVVKNFLTKMKEKKEIKPNNYEEVDLNIGDLVKITEGTFINREGRIAQLDKKKQKAKIVIESSGWEISDVPVNICQKVMG